MNMQELMRQAQSMQKKLEQARDDAGKKTVEGSAGGGMVVVTCNGKNEIVGVKIEKEVVDPEELEMLQDLVMAATNQALQRANDMMRDELAKITGGMPLPGIL